MERSTRISAAAGSAGLALLVAGTALVALGVSGHHDAASVFGILAAVLGLVGLRVRSWIRKEHRLRQVAEDLHVPRDG